MVAPARFGVCSIFSFIIFLHFLPGSFAFYFNCDPVNQGHYCLCAKGEPGTWDISCPARILEVYPVSLKLSMSPYGPEEASMRIICDPNKGHFGWRLVQGLDFENENITFSITSLEISYCPLISTIDLKNFFQQMKLDPEDIQSFSFHTWKQNITFPSDFLSIMPNLEIVDLKNNKLESLPSFQGLTFLNQLNLRGNQLKEIPNKAFKNNAHLEQIHLGANLLSKLNYPIFPDSLIFLDLVDNHITTITNESFSNLQHLQVLYLNNNPLERVESGAFNSLKNLTELSLDYSKLFSLPVLKNLPKLTNLSISYSLFTSTQLVTTTLSPSDLVDVRTESVTENTNYYTSTTAKGENTVTMTTGSSDYGDVISGDEMTVRGRSEDVMLDEENKEELIGDLYALRKLILINDDLKSLSWLGYLPNLTDLVLSRNELQTIPKGFFLNVPSVIHVDFSQNAITELSEMDAPLMSYLDLSNNFVRILDHHYFKQLRQLRVLIIATNKIEYIHPRAFEFLDNLMVLDLSNNLISFQQGPPTTMAQQRMEYDTPTTMITTTMESEEENMREIQAQNQSPLQYLTKVERINLKNNLISKIFMDWTFAPTNLRSLDLSRNQIKSLHPRDLYFVSQDVRFDLRYNEITDVDMDFAELLLEPLENKNVVVLLDGNPLHCDCQAIAFKKFAVKSYHLQYSELICSSPENLKGKKFGEIPAKDLRCMLSQSCPQGCQCYELPSENVIKMECTNLNFLSSREKSSLKNFTDVYEPLSFEVDFSKKPLKHIHESLMNEIPLDFKLLNLTETGLTSLDFLLGFPQSNNYTKFALSKNPFKCDGCKFQRAWWKHFKRIVDIRSVTCEMKKGENSTELLTFQDIVKSSVCTDDAISDEIRFLIIILAIMIPVIIATIICITRLQKEKRERVRKSKLRKTESMVGSLGAQPRAYTRSKVAEMDNSKF